MIHHRRGPVQLTQPPVSRRRVEQYLDELTADGYAKRMQHGGNPQWWANHDAATCRYCVSPDKFHESYPVQIELDLAPRVIVTRRASSRTVAPIPQVHVNLNGAMQEQGWMP